MDNVYIIQKIVVYIRDTEKVKLFFGIPKYRLLVYSSKSYFNELFMIYGEKYWDCTLDWCIAKGKFELVKWLYDKNKIAQYTTDAIDWCALGDHLEIIKWLFDNRIEGACIQSNDCIRYNLSKKRKFGYWTKMAFEKAAIRGQFETIKWLYQHHTEGCYDYDIDRSEILDNAVMGGDLEIVKWLICEQKARTTLWTMDTAIERGHLEIVKWLYEKWLENSNISLYWSRNAILEAIQNGHVEIIKFYEETMMKGNEEHLKWLNKHKLLMVI